jgi:DNA repair protein RecO (recombination protein O)
LLLKTNGIVLKTMDYGEGNKILTVFSKEMGKMGLMARGARKTKSRNGAVSQPFILAHFILHQGTGLGTLQQGEIIHSYPKIRQDLYRTAYATYALELTDKLTEDRQRNPVLYDLLITILNYIEAGKDPEILLRIFEMKVLSMIGNKPVMNACLSCKKGLSPWYFSVKEGGLLCHGCRHIDHYAIPLLEGVPRLLYVLQEIDLANLGQIKVKDTTKSQLQKIMYMFMDEYVGIRLKSRRFLEQLAKMDDSLLRKEQNDGEGTHA